MAWVSPVVFLHLVTSLITVKAQLNLYAAKRDVSSFLKLNFNFDLYLIKNDEPVMLLKDPRAFYSFMAPLQASVKGVKLSWYSSPQSTYYSMKFTSSDNKTLNHPIPQIDSKGVVPHLVEPFYVPLECTGRKKGYVDISLQLNYTRIVGTSVIHGKQKSFEIRIKKWCDKTIKEPDKDHDKDLSHWSRGSIVGLSAGITVFLCLSVGLGLLFKHYMRQRKLKMKFEDDIDFEEKREFDQKKITSLPIVKPSCSTSKSTPVLYSPKRNKLRSAARTRHRSETNASDTSTIELIGKEDSDDDSGLMFSKEETSLKVHRWRNSLSDILLDPEKLDIREYTGKGCLGELYHGILKRQAKNGEDQIIEVIVEVIKDGMDGEISKQVLSARSKQLDHPNILQPHGVILGSTTEIVLPYNKFMCLDEFLMQHGAMLSDRQLVNIALKICKALDYMHSENHIYKHLSSKQCLITEDLDAQISLCSKISDTRWMAPESLTCDVFSYQSDVWSFGVLLWQITSLGEQPFSEIPIDDLSNYLEAGNLLKQPLTCSDELYSVILKCCSLEAFNRPSSQWIAEWLQSYLYSLDSKESTIC